MKFKFISTIIASIILCGCASENARYIKSGGSEAILSTNQIDMSDWNKASADFVKQIIRSGAIDKTGLPLPAKIKVSRIINRTSKAIDTELLTNQICIALNNSGKAVAVSDDPTTNELAEYEAKRQGKSISLPKLTITGKIIEVREINSDYKEVTYTFFLEVNHLGKSIWMGQKQIAKQADRSSFGF